LRSQYQSYTLTIIAFSLLVALSGGIYLAGAVQVFGDPRKTEAVIRTVLG